jgi:hypothetical protein
MAVDTLVEFWLYLAIDMIVGFGRTVARWKRIGLRGLAVDDYLMVVALVWHACLPVVTQTDSPPSYSIQRKRQLPTMSKHTGSALRTADRLPLVSHVGHYEHSSEAISQSIRSHIVG